MKSLNLVPFFAPIFGWNESESLINDLFDSVVWNDRVLSDIPAKLYSTLDFKFDEESKKYTATLSVDPNTPVAGIKVGVLEKDGMKLITISTEYTSETGKMSTYTENGIPKDLDVATLKAKVKKGVITITADKLPEPTEKKIDTAGDETEYELEIDI